MAFGLQNSKHSKDALNLLLESKMAVVKSYVSQTCVVTKENDLTTTSRLDNDIFNGSLPYKLYVFAMQQNRYNGAANLNSLRIQWENTDFQLSVNGTAIGPCIKNSRQAYWHLRKFLHKGESMPFTFDQYKADFGIIGVELCATKDIHIKVLPLNQKVIYPVRWNLHKMQDKISLFITWVFFQINSIHLLLHYHG